MKSAADPTAPAYRLTNDTLADQWPSVSPDGNAVVWTKATPAGTYDIWRAEQTNGNWGAPEQVTSIDGNESFPDTNGPVTVYASDAGGDEDIRWSVKDSSGAYVEAVLDLPGVQRTPNIAGNLITFESSAAVGSQYDIWLYDLVTNRLYQLTDTSISESNPKPISAILPATAPAPTHAQDSLEAKQRELEAIQREAVGLDEGLVEHRQGGGHGPRDHEGDDAQDAPPADARQRASGVESLDQDERQERGRDDQGDEGLDRHVTSPFDPGGVTSFVTS